MLGMINQFVARFAELGLEFEAPRVIQTLSEEELIHHIGGFDGWIAGDDPATARVLEAGARGRLRALVKWGVGTDNIDFDTARRLGIRTAHTPGVFGREVADIAMHYVVALARNTFWVDREIRLRASWPKPQGISLAGRTAALVGFGDIGRQTARRLIACDMRIIAYDPCFRPAGGIEVEPATWPERIDEADFIIFTCPLTDKTRHLFNMEILERLKPGVRIVNVARGPVVSETALVEALRRGIVHSAALDVFETEPLPADSPLRAFERCIFGSHNASNTREAVERVSLQAIDLLVELMGCKK
ncbi:MAG: phosphoglycerate dehydrogenase [Gammaproteobacteria bacterium]|nr:MAG: phosphoglycerate dehydrogenase [Gammaproteobacteria bacterium]